MREKFIVITFWITLSIILLPSFAISQPCVTFDWPTAPFGTQYGTPAGHSPGNLIYTENGIDVILRNFYWTPTSSTFNFCQIDPPFSGFGFNKIMQTNNINLEFYFGFLPYPVTCVTFIFADLGGIENISLGTMPPYIGDLTGYIPPSGYTFTTSTAPIPGGLRGTATLYGSYIDTLIVGGQELWLDSICVCSDTTGINDGESQQTMLPGKFVLHQNFPNPFNPATTIRFEIPVGWNTPLTVQIFNLQGQLVKTLIDDVKLSPGMHRVVWDGKDTAGKRMSSGIYFSRVTSDHFIAAIKMLLAR